MSENVSKKEISLYPSILKWLMEYLQNKHPKAEIQVHDVHSIDIGDFFQRKGFTKYFPEYATYKIRVDLVGMIFEKNECKLVFVEVKDTPLNLINLSQLLGYCKILKPEFAFLVSPKGLGRPLWRLLHQFNRLDILEFNKNRFVRVAKWDSSRNSIDISSVVPSFSKL